MTEVTDVERRKLICKSAQTLRNLAGLTQEEAALRLGVKVDWLRSFEQGRPKRVDAVFLSRLGEAYGVGALEVFGLLLDESQLTALIEESVERAHATLLAHQKNLQKDE